MLNNIIRLWHHTSSKRRWQLGVLLAISIISAVSEVLTIGAVIPFLAAISTPDLLFNHPNIKPILTILAIDNIKVFQAWVTVAFSVIVVLAALIRFANIILQFHLSYALGADLGVKVYQHTLYQPYAKHIAQNSSELIAAVTQKVRATMENVLMPFIFFITSSIVLVSILLTLLYIEPIVAVVTLLGFGSVYGLITLFTQKKLDRNSKALSQANNQSVKALQEGLGGIRDVLIDGTQEFYKTTYSDTIRKLNRAHANISIIANSPRVLIEGLGIVLLSTIAYALTSRESRIDAAIPIIGTMALGAQKLLPLLQYIYSAITSIRGNASIFLDTLELIEQPLPAFALQVPPQPMPYRHRISIQNLSFRYHDTDTSPWIIKDFNLEINKGARIGFKGQTGSGKSTLLDILMGLLMPTQGKILIDGVEVGESNYRHWQALIAHVPQSIYLSDSTIAENIAFGVAKDKIDFAKVVAAAKQAQIATTIEHMQLQYNTMVGERGVRLSGGQRQRIGIARALYKNASVIMFDEATSALDNDTEEEVMQAIDQLNDDLTILIIAHRLSTLRNCDEIVELIKYQ